MCIHDGLDEECSAKCRCDCMNCIMGENESDIDDDPYYLAAGDGSAQHYFVENSI
jgi:hypothetical protein